MTLSYNQDDHWPRLSILARDDAERDLGPEAADLLRSSELIDLLIAHGAWRARRPAPRKRVVHLSTLLRGSQACEDNRQVIDEIVADLTAGVDVVPRLSKAAHAPAVQRGSKIVLQGPDRLLAEWGIHHLHLGAVRDGWAARTRDLLFAVIRPDDAYLLVVLPHGRWTDRSILETAVREWPAAELFAPVHGATGISAEYNEADHERLRNAGVTVIQEVDDKIYMPQGQALTGTSLPVVRAAQEFLIVLEQAENAAQEPGELMQLAAHHGVTVAHDAVWRPYRHEGWYGLVEPITGLFVQFARLPGGGTC